MNVEFVNPFLGALVDVLATMAQTEAHRGPLSLKRDETALGEVTGLIDLKGSQATGSLAVTFSESAILAIFQRMLGEIRETVDAEVADLVGELTNMVTGGAKKVFAEKGLDFAMATPVLLTGAGHAIHHPVRGPTVLVPFYSDAGAFYVEVCFGKPEGAVLPVKEGEAAAVSPAAP